MLDAEDRQILHEVDENPKAPSGPEEAERYARLEEDGFLISKPAAEHEGTDNPPMVYWITSDGREQIRGS